MRMIRKESLIREQGNFLGNLPDILLRKTIEGYWNSFDFITIEKIIFKHSSFISDRTTTMQFTKMQNEIYGSLVTIQYHAKCTDPLYPKFTCNKFCAYVFLLQPLPGNCLCSNSDHRRVFTPIYKALTLIIGQLLQQNTQIWHTRANMATNWQ